MELTEQGPSFWLQDCGTVGAQRTFAFYYNHHLLTMVVIVILSNCLALRITSTNTMLLNQNLAHDIQPSKIYTNFFFFTLSSQCEIQVLMNAKQSSYH